MTVLNTIKRPTVVFDVTNSDHRKWLGYFTLNRSWGNCPVVFYSAGGGNSIAQMQLRLLEYYVQREFGNN